MSKGTWLGSIRAEEREMGVDHRELACYASLLTPYVRDHLSHAAHGIEGLYTQLPSTFVPDAVQRARWESERETFVEQMCSVVRHLGAALTAVGCTDNEMIAVLERSEGGVAEKDVPVENDTPEVKNDSEKTVVTPIPLATRTLVVKTGK